MWCFSLIKIALFLFGPFCPPFAMLFENANVFSGIDEDKRTGTLGVRCKTRGSKMILYLCDLFIYLMFVFIYKRSALKFDQ